MRAYYNDTDPFCCDVLRARLADGSLPAGDVDDRDIREVSADDLEGYTEAHFFAGIGGWPLALRLAGWPDDESVWTGSCPCQPFSSAGRAGGLGDERHLWPAFHRLIAECGPAIVFGEQVASKNGRLWLAGVRTDLERLGYAVGAADLPAAGVGAPHPRQRLFWFTHLYGDDHFGSEPSIRSSPGVAERAMAESFQIRNRGFAELVAMGCTERVRSYAEARRLVDGIPACMVQVRAYGNAIVPQIAAEFIGAVMETMREKVVNDGGT